MFILLALFPIFFLLGLHFSFVRFRDTRISRVINIKAKQNTHTLLKKTITIKLPGVMKTGLVNIF